MNEVLRSGLPITKSLTIPASYKELIKKMNKVENIELNQNFQNTETKLFLKYPQSHVVRSPSRCWSQNLWSTTK